VRDLLTMSAGHATPAKLDALAARYRAKDNSPLLGVDTGHGLAACIGLTLAPNGSAVVQHIAVAPAEQRQGLGRSLVEGVAALYELTGLSAETDRDAVDFYRHCGFDVASLGEVYPGTERFRCTLAVAPPATRRQRAAALIVQLGRVVLLHRWNYGREYYVLPGGGIKLQETPAEACLREVREETSLHVILVRPLGVLVNLGRVEHYFLTAYQGGKLRLGEPERSHQSANNRYVPEWVAAEDLTRINFLPAGEREFFRAIVSQQGGSIAPHP
jgi:8-oxo-dGTP diphosphatase